MKLILFGILLLLCLGATWSKPDKCKQKTAMGGMEQDGAACMAYMPTWTYDANQNACLEFVFGGCGGNSNQFTSKSECETACKD